MEICSGMGARCVSDDGWIIDLIVHWLRRNQVEAGVAKGAPAETSHEAHCRLDVEVVRIAQAARDGAIELRDVIATCFKTVSCIEGGPHDDTQALQSWEGLPSLFEAEKIGTTERRRVTEAEKMNQVKQYDKFKRLP